MSNSGHLNMVLLLSLGVVVWAGSHVYEILSGRRPRAPSPGGARNDPLGSVEPKPLPRV
ncbi:MAG TPA: hypothetical protein VMT47_10085 [Polyangia bacterium]|nr:hypothetical protein [Polyangia bacterium]